MTEPDRPTPPEALAQPSSEVEDPIITLYKDWVKDALKSEFGEEGSSREYLDFFGHRVDFRINQWGGLEDLFKNTYRSYVPEVEKPKFHAAVAGVIAQRSMDPELKADEAMVLVRTAHLLKIADAAEPLSNILINNPQVRADNNILTFGSQIVFWLGLVKGVDKEKAAQLEEKLLDSEYFNDGVLIECLRLLINIKPENAEHIIMKYAERIRTFKELVVKSGGRDLDIYKIKIESIIEYLDSLGVKSSLSSGALSVILI